MKEISIIILLLFLLPNLFLTYQHKSPIIINENMTIENIGYCPEKDEIKSCNTSKKLLIVTSSISIIEMIIIILIVRNVIM